MIEYDKNIDDIIKKYGIDITTKTKNNQGILILNALYFLANGISIPNIHEDFIYPRNISFDYAKLLIKYNKTSLR